MQGQTASTFLVQPKACSVSKSKINQGRPGPPSPPLLSSQAREATSCLERNSTWSRDTQIQLQHHCSQLKDCPE